MSLYDDEENPLLVRPSPFWEEEPVRIAQPAVAAPAAPPPEVEDEGYASLADIPEAAPPPEVEEQGYASLDDVPVAEKPPVEEQGYGSLDEVSGAKPEEEGFLKRAGRLALATAGLSVPNIGQAKAVLDPDTQKAAIDVADKLKNSTRSGWLSGDVAMELQKQNPSLDYVAQQQRLIDTLKPDADFNKAWDDNAPAQESWDAFKKDPLGNIAQLFGQSMGAAVRASKDYVLKPVERTLQGAILGAGMGAPIAGVGAIPGTVLGARAGFAEGMAEMSALGSYANEYAGSMISSLTEAGIDVKNADQLKAAFSNPELMAPIRASAEKKGVPVALFDGLAGAMNGNLFTAPGKTLGKKAWQWGAELLVDSLSGGVGELTSQLAEKGKVTSWRSILAELGMEPIQSVPQVAVNRATAGLDLLTTPLPEPPMAPGVTTAPATSGEVPGVTPPITPVEGRQMIGLDHQGQPIWAPVATPPEVFAPPPAAPPPIPFQPGQQVTGPVEGVAGTVTSIEPDGKVMVDWQDENPPQAMAPEHLEMVIEPDVAGKTIATKVQADNTKVQQIASEKAANLQASAAPKTADALKQVAQTSNQEASITAAEFLRQAQAVENAPPLPETPAAPAAAAPAPAAPAAAAPAPVTGDERFAPPAAVPAAAPATPAAPTTTTEPVKAIAVGGQVFTGPTHADAMETARAAVGPDAIRTAETGWVDPETGQFSIHAIFDAHAALNTAMEQSGNNPEAPAVQQAQAKLAQAHARNAEVNNQIVQPGGEQVVPTGVKGQVALVSPRPSQQLVTPLAGVNVTVEGVTADGQKATAQRPAAQALNEARNDKTALTILLDCIT